MVTLMPWLLRMQRRSLHLEEERMWGKLGEESHLVKVHPSFR